MNSARNDIATEMGADARRSDTVQIALFNGHIYIHHFERVLRLYSEVTPSSWQRVLRIQQNLPHAATGLWRY